LPVSRGALSIDEHRWVSFWVGDSHSISSFEISYDQQQLAGGDVSGHPWKVNRQMFSYFSKDVLDQTDQDVDAVSEVFEQGASLKSQIDKKLSVLSQATVSVDAVLSRLSDNTPQAIYCGTANLLYIFPQDIKDAFLSGTTWPDPGIGQSEYCQTLEALKTGMATPLRISFNPKEPYYPLVISSLGEGSAMVETYVVANGSVIDHNGILAEAKHLALSGALKASLSREFGEGAWNYVTRLTWKGELKDLKKDAIFFVLQTISSE